MEHPSVQTRPDEARTSELPSRKGGFERIAATATETANRGAAAAATATETLVRQAGNGAAQAEDIAHGMSRLLQETTRGMQAAMMLPMAPSGGLAEMQEAMAEMVTGMMRNNIRLAEDLMKIYSPQEYSGLQRKLMQQWVDNAMQGQAMLLRMTRQVTDQALRPFER
jgi:hypothetical protein